MISPPAIAAPLCILSLLAAFAAYAAPAKPDVARPVDSWRVVGNRMTDERRAPGYALLPDRRVALIVGGYSYAKRSCVAGIDLFDASTLRFRPSRARLPYPADFVLAAPLPSGLVLLVGGFNDVWGSLDTAALYNPAADACTRIPARMRDRRELAQATPLLDGRVLITGGLSLDAGTTLATAELYDPSSRTFSLTAAPLAGDRFGHAACRLADGRVLIVGGTHWDIRRRDSKVLATAEIYDPATNKFMPSAGSLTAARDRPTSTLLPDGAVLIAGGQGPGGAPVTSAELFDPVTARFTTVPSAPLAPRMAHDAASLPSGDVLLTGGWDAAKRATTAACILYDWTSHRFIPLPDLPFATHDQALVVFPNGVALCAGGKIAHGTFSSAEDHSAVIHLHAPYLDLPSRSQKNGFPLAAGAGNPKRM